MTSEDQLREGSTAKPGGRLRFVWPVLLSVLLVGAYAAMFIPALAGRQIDNMSFYSSMFWNSIFFYSLWRFRSRTGWHGALIGAAVGVIAFFLAAVLSGYVRASAG